MKVFIPILIPEEIDLEHCIHSVHHALSKDYKVTSLEINFILHLMVMAKHEKETREKAADKNYA